MRHPRAFTLIELLICIAIIALLLAFAVPLLRTSRDAGRSAVCGSNLRQLATAFNVYRDENNREWATSFWQFIEQPETGQPAPRFMRCPSDKLTREDRTRISYELCGYFANGTGTFHSTRVADHNAGQFGVAKDKEPVHGYFNVSYLDTHTRRMDR